MMLYPTEKEKLCSELQDIIMPYHKYKDYSDIYGYIVEGAPDEIKQYFEKWKKLVCELEEERKNRPFL